MPSIFSRIVTGEIPCHKVYEDDLHLAFLDLRPVKPGHTLVIPKREVPYLFDLPPEEHAALWEVAHGVARRIRERLQCARVCVAVIGYEVPHAHIHLVPTNAIADFPWRGGHEARPEELAAMATRLGS
jgi:histidine triad (HIT) family protein